MKLILGLGITGLSVARFFFKNDISFRIADSRQEPPMLEVAEKEGLLQIATLVNGVSTFRRRYRNNN